MEDAQNVLFRVTADGQVPPLDGLVVDRSI
jgi:hypothetical protein